MLLGILISHRRALAGGVVQVFESFLVSFL
jgi:hypothetical protein